MRKHSKVFTQPLCYLFVRLPRRKNCFGRVSALWRGLSRIDWIGKGRRQCSISDSASAKAIAVSAASAKAYCSLSIQRHSVTAVSKDGLKFQVQGSVVIKSPFRNESQNSPFRWESQQFRWESQRNHGGPVRILKSDSADVVESTNGRNKMEE